MTKAARQATIRDILSRQAITSQEDLRRALGKSGFKVTQATLSRDMKELGVSRLARGGGRFEYSIPAEPDLNDLRPIVGAEVMGIDANEYLIVVRTIPGAITLIPGYVFYARLGWIKKDLPLIIPSLVVPFGVFTLRQFFKSITKER